MRIRKQQKLEKDGIRGKEELGNSEIKEGMWVFKKDENCKIIRFEI